MKIEENMQHFWHIMLYYFKQGKNATEMQKKICAVYGEGAVIDPMCQKRFVKFCVGDFSLDNTPQLGGLVEVDSYQIETLIEYSQCSHVGDIQYTQNIQINKVTGENETFVFCVTEKN